MHTRNHPLTSVQRVHDAMFQGPGRRHQTSARTFINQVQCLHNFMYAAALNFLVDTFGTVNKAIMQIQTSSFTGHHMLTDNYNTCLFSTRIVCYNLQLLQPMYRTELVDQEHAHRCVTSRETSHLLKRAHVSCGIHY